MQKIRFNYADKTLFYSNKTQLKQFIESIFVQENKALHQIQYIFCSDEYLLAINKQSLNHDYYTDIITFGLSLPKEPVEAEIYISIDRVKENAETLGVSFKDELLRVAFHGALHLCGYKDKRKADISIMRNKENYYIHQFLSK
jgi:probable rRNA maturation factor